MQRKHLIVMSDLEFEELVQYVSDNINHDLDRYAYNRMYKNREPLYSACPELAERISDLVSDWCMDNDIDEDDVWGEISTDDIFEHDKYNFDA